MKKGRRLTASADFQRVYREGKSVGNNTLVLYYFEKKDPGESRIGFSVSKKIGSAVHRNKVKRLFREVFRNHAANFKSNYDYVIIAKRAAKETGYNELEKSMFALFKKSNLVIGD